MNSITIGDELESTLYVVWACTFGISSHPIGTLFAVPFTKAVDPLRAVAGSALFTLDFSPGDHAKNMQKFRTDVRVARKRYGATMTVAQEIKRCNNGVDLTSSSLDDLARFSPYANFAEKQYVRGIILSKFDETINS